MTTVEIGKRAELLAIAFLKKQGLTIVQQNYRCRFGEIDIIATDHSTLVFVEVRKRKSIVHAINSIDEHKQKKLTITAGHYLAHTNNDNICRFDTLLIDDNNKIQWIKNAFSADF